MKQAKEMTKKELIEEVERLREFLQELATIAQSWVPLKALPGTIYSLTRRALDGENATFNHIEQGQP